MEDSGWLVLHFGMSGRLQYAKSSAALPQDAELLMQFDSAAALAYIAPRKLGRIGWTEAPDDFIASLGLGPDALSVDYATFWDMARGRRGGVKAWLMDQSALAGIGNLYSDEILFQASVHPRQAVAELGDEQLKVLHRTMRRVLNQATDARADPDAMPRSFLLPHRHVGGRCPRCGERLSQIKAAGRTAFFCPHCQGGRL